MQHANSRKVNLVADYDKLSFPRLQSKSVSVRRIIYVEVFSAPVLNGVVDIFPRKAALPLSDDEDLVVVLVERVAGIDFGSILNDQIDDGSVFEKSMWIPP